MMEASDQSTVVVGLVEGSESYLLEATKRLKDNRNLPKDEEKKLKERWQQEYDYTLNLKTDYIVRGLKLSDSKFLNYLNESHGNWRPLPVIVMEYCNGGDLRSHLMKPENMNGLGEFEVCEVMSCLRHAVEYLHNKCNLKHRDLKPDNIVIKRDDSGRCIYKLTDFGFARSCCEDTILQSVVGTRNYFAPEVVDTAKYTKTVDYWSMGVIAFELLTGVLPFIPHQSLFNIIVNIKKKPANCIAITQVFSGPNTGDTFQFDNSIFPENQVSSVLRVKMENWLRLVLDKDYRTRGSVPADAAAAVAGNCPANGPRILKVYTELDSIFHTRVLTVFCLNTYKFYAYEVNESLNFESFLSSLQRDLKIARSTLYFILPTGHPRSLFDKTVKKPLDMFVDEWRDGSNSDNPHAMLYVTGFESGFESSEPHISEVIKFGLKNKKLPRWLQQTFARHLHFLVANEQRHFKALVQGLHEYALSLEHEIFSEKGVALLLKEILIMRGRVEHFVSMVTKAQHSYESQLDSEQLETFEKWTKKAENYSAEINQIDTEVGPKIERRYNSAHRRIKEQATNKQWKQLGQCDFYKLEKLREHHHVKPDDWMTQGDLCSTCDAKVYECLEDRSKWLRHDTIKLAQQQIPEVNLEFQKIKSAVEDARKYLAKMAMNLEEDTFNFFKSTADAWTRGKRNGDSNQLKADGLLPTVVNDFDLSSLHGLVNTDADNLIRMVEMTLESFESKINL